MSKLNLHSPSEDPDHHKPKKRKKKLASSPHPSKPSTPRPRDDESPLGRSQRRPRRAASSAILTRDEIKVNLCRLPVMLLSGVINTAQANSIRATLQTLLQADKADGTTIAGGRELSVAAAAIQADPRLTGLLAGFMSDEEIDAIVRQAGIETPESDDRPAAAKHPKLNRRKSGDENE